MSTEIYPWTLTHMDFSGRQSVTKFYLDQTSTDSTVMQRFKGMFSQIQGGVDIEVESGRRFLLQGDVTFSDHIPIYARWDLCTFSSANNSYYHCYIPCADYTLLERGQTDLDLDLYKIVDPFTGVEENMLEFILFNFRSREGHDVDFKYCRLVWQSNSIIPQVNPVGSG